MRTDSDNQPCTDAHSRQSAGTASTGVTHRLGCRLSLSVGYGLAEQVSRWASDGHIGYVCVANTHQVAQAQSGSGLHNALANALAVTSDSQVLGKALRLLGTPYPEPVLYGPDLMQAVIAQAEKNELSIALFGSTQSTCEAVLERARREHPALRIRGIVCPPVQPLHELVDGTHAEQLRQLNADIVLVSLGCPKQELWMHESNAAQPGIKIGLGGAFDFYAGQRARSPEWVHRAGLEWLYRLCCEPRRLLTRYLVNNPVFIMIWLRARLFGSSQSARPTASNGGLG